MSDRPSPNAQPVASPFACGHPSDFGPLCDLQPADHGGLMHSGLEDDRRVWWDEDGERVVFGA